MSGNINMSRNVNGNLSVEDIRRVFHPQGCGGPPMSVSGNVNGNLSGNLAGSKGWCSGLARWWSGLARVFPRSPLWRFWLPLLLALGLLNAALSFYGRWPTPWIEWRWQLAPEIALLVLLLGLVIRLAGRPSGRLIGVLAGLLTLLVLVRYFAVMAPALYGRPVNLVADARYVPDLIPMLLQSAPWPLLLGVPLGLLLLLGVLSLMFLALRGALKQLVLALEARAPGRALTLAAGVILATYLAGLASGRPTIVGAFSRPVTLELADQAVLGYRFMTAEAGTALAPDLPPSDLGGVRGAHVVILFAESYGAATLDQPRLAAALAPARADLAAALVETGRQAVSARVRSPTFAGSSWLAHASLLAGVEVKEQEDYSRLLSQPRETLVHRFARAGYRTLAVMPGLRYDWPDGAFYGYDALLDAQALDYGGPAFGWWRIPDQFTLASLDARELTVTATPTGPRLVVLGTISSHAPFHPPPAYQPDWGRLLGEDPFGTDADPPALAGPTSSLGLSSLGGSTEAAGGLESLISDPAAAYAATLDYLLRVLAGWLRHRADLDLVLVVIGDHQPLAAISGEGANWEVPVHLISARSALFQPFLKAGFVPGLIPAVPAIGGMADLTPLVLRAFRSGAGPQRHAGPEAAGVDGLPVWRPGG